MSTTDIAEHFEATRPTVGKRLDELEEQGLVGHTKVGKASVWYLPELENRRLIEYQPGDDVDVQTIAGWARDDSGEAKEPEGVDDKEQPGQTDILSGAADPEPDGGAGEAELREAFGDLEGEFRGLLHDVIEKYEQERARIENERRSWGELSRARGKSLGVVALGAGAGGFLLILSLLLMPSSWLTAAIPFGGGFQFTQLLGVMFGVAFFVFILAAVSAVAHLAAWRSGFADWLERSRVGEWWDRTANDANTDT